MKDEIQQFLSFAFPGNPAIEIRSFLKNGQIMAGTFTDMTDAAKNAAAISIGHNPKAIYFTLNCIAPADIHRICCREPNKVAQRARVTAKDINCPFRALYLIDVDPVRPSGVCSTEAEKGKALAVLHEVEFCLKNLGWPDPIMIDSGNGYHLLYRGDGCAANLPEWRFILGYLGRRFNTPGANVDPTVFNPARISRLPGTWNRKGLDTPERPHRKAHVLRYPDRWDALTVEEVCIVANANGFTDPIPRRRVGSTLPHSPDQGVSAPSDCQANGDLLIDVKGVESLIIEYPEVLSLDRVSRDGDTTYFALSECPFVGRPHHDQTSGHGKTALILSPRTFGFKCFSDDCEGKGIGDLLKLLRAKTGRRCSIPIWKPRDLANCDRVPASITDVARADEKAQEALVEQRCLAHEKKLMATPEWKYDKATWDTMNSSEFAENAAPPEPHLWGLTREDIYPTYAALHKEYGIQSDLTANRIGGILGPQWLFALQRQKYRQSQHNTKSQALLHRDSASSRLTLMRRS